MSGRRGLDSEDSYEEHGHTRWRGLILLHEDELLSRGAAARAVTGRLVTLDVMATTQTLPDNGHLATDRRLVPNDSIQHSHRAGLYGDLRQKQIPHGDDAHQPIVINNRQVTAVTIFHLLQRGLIR